ncbi:MAG: 5-amino-6-(D-ribitylamino)uracil--L-tyrosine 4-hydroxyphenyl transferase CofH [Polyangiaceae bacterium]|nr:5-amino-6-(D-ribitylamino)uracil--L-tyrosine 4-hydroxyphenyl transferase CofH [Polyangiaceae bacterium]
MSDEALELEAALRAATAGASAALSRALSGHELSLGEATQLAGARGADLAALVAVADHLRREQVGDTLTYVVNRNINFTNVCVKSCHFCAFSRDSRSEQGYFLPREEVVRRAVEARDLGATEVCLQAGLAPGMDPRHYAELCRAVKAAAPELHLHAFSPEEIKYGARLAGVTPRELLIELRDAGLGSLPGTSAEVLVPEVRERIARGRIRVEEWLEVVRTAHELGIPTTATLMFGHVESAEHRARHLLTLRELQAATGGFTELVPLAFVHEEAPLFARQLDPEVEGGPGADTVTATFALARVVLGTRLPNLQVSWVKHGFAEAARLLGAGANDLGGTLINESISTSAGAHFGQLASPAKLRALAREAGRLPAERDTRYRVLRRFGADASADPLDPLDALSPEEAAARFGSYAELAASQRYRFELRRRPGRATTTGADATRE